MYFGNTTVILRSNPTANAIVSDSVLLISHRMISELELVLVFRWFQRLVVYAVLPQKKISKMEITKRGKLTTPYGQ